MRAVKLGSRIYGPGWGLKRLSPSFVSSSCSARACASSAGTGMAEEGRTTQDGDPVDLAMSVLVNYHEETKHRSRKYARGPHRLDWANQPNPFRRYDGARVVPLDHLPESPTRSSDPLWPVIFEESLAPKPLDKSSLSQLLYDSLALSAWKAARRSTWSLRVNPSSGNLHPTEGYVICDAIEGVSMTPFVAHYAPYEHVLEIRAEISVEKWRYLSSGLPPGSLLFGFSSIFWRESWKYGERAFRYCNHDVGHAIGAVAIASASLGWNACMLDGYSVHEIGCLLGLPQVRVSTDRGPVRGVMRELETEHADCVLAIFPSGLTISEQPNYQVAKLMGDVKWQGQMSALSKEHMSWGIIYEAAQASEKSAVTSAAITRSLPLPDSIITSAEYEPVTVRQVVRKRRSAESMDSTYAMLAEVFFQILAKTLPTGSGETQGAPRQLPFGALPWNAEVHLVIFAHRVVGLQPGVYILVRNEAYTKELAKLMKPEFSWEKPEICPPSLPLYALQYGNVTGLAQRLSCDQEIAGDGFFSLGMLARFESAMRDFGPSMYPRLFWETGLIGQMLYLEAHAFGVSGTGIGCFFDDPVHTVLGLKDNKFQSLYHFTIGVPVEDKRIQTVPSYPAPPGANF
uniref:Nitroreductase domain-containing protein n=1 Tax=Physcomitrium patens TaxID=3218 RepID=A0A2K1J0D8_PHYPA|nr:uncharacterized protein LOC112295648 [Physcomitrium patens]PNR34979.1 hypothetical protein PHYPA_022878 [Physcomitrium patens]|eukprot:XP_024403261.1 uncharacterized protein LOC112295648 [Physcomitrella patens]